MCSFSWVATSPVALAFGNVRTNTMERRHTHTHKNTYIHSHPYALRSDHAAVLLLGAPYNISLLRSCSPSHSDYRTPVAFYVIPFLCKASPNLHLLSRNLSLSLSIILSLVIFPLSQRLRGRRCRSKCECGTKSNCTCHLSYTHNALSTLKRVLSTRV